MSLVADYGSSDSEGSDVEAAPVMTNKKLGLSLPPPKNMPGKSKLGLPAPKNKSVVYADLPARHDEDDDEEEARERKAKRSKLNSSGSFGLADLLPAPKNTSKAPVTQKATDAAFMPLSLARKLKKGKEKAAENGADQEEKKEDEEKWEKEQEQQEEVLPKQHTGSFFRIGIVYRFEEKEMRRDRTMIRINSVLYR